MPSAGKPWWQQATALVSLGAGGAVTGLAFAPQPAADLTSPTSMPVHLMALEQSARPAAADDAALRSAIVNVANYYRRLAESKTPAEMEAIIWQHDSVDGVNHGASCAAFASLTLELGAHVTGRQSWVTGGSSYPWPLHDWVDARVNPNPGSPGITSIVQDAQAHGRWHPVGDAYQPLPGDWVVFDGHVEVVTKYADGVLSTIGGDSVPNFSVNAHEYPGSFASQGVLGFVDNGALPTMAGKAHPAGDTAPAGRQDKNKADGGRRQADGSSPAAPAELPVAAAPALADDPAGAMADTTVIPGLPIMAHRLSSGPTAPPAAHPKGQYKRHAPSSAAAPVQASGSQQAFIDAVAPGAIAAQRRYGVPASVTIAQAIDESGWGQSTLASHDHNLFGIKGTGPAGSVSLPTQEYQNGQLVTSTNAFRVYHNTAESIDDHGRLLATSGYYRQSMADRRNPDAFAQSLTGIYATDPSYGTKLVGLMQRYDLYRYNAAAPAGQPSAARPNDSSPVGAAIPGLPVPAPTTPRSTGSRAPAPRGAPAAGQDSASQHRGPRPVTTRPTPPASVPPATPTAPPPSATPSVAPSATASPERTPSGAPSGPAPSSAPSRRPASGRPSAAAPAAPTPSGTRSSARPTDGAGPTARSRPAPSAAPASAPPAAPAPSAPPSGPAPSGRRASGTPARPAPSAAASQRPAPAPAASGPSPVVPGLPVTATAAAGTATAGTAPSGHESASAAGAAAPLAAAPAALTVYAGRMAAPARRRARRTGTRHTSKPPRRYRQQMPPSVRNAFVSTARGPLLRAEPLYQDVASYSGISWELLAACDWMQCEARARYSPVHGEKLGTVNRDGTSYHTKSEALEQCAEDMVELAEAVYGIDLTAPEPVSVRDLANAFAAFRWGGLLRLHRTSAMEFPYSVAGLTPQHTRMRWPNIADPNTPDRPGRRFRKPFGAVPIVLSLNYPATV
jgi:flagellum-specific peptidoglycan hydrolase FlgJ